MMLVCAPLRTITAPIAQNDKEDYYNYFQGKTIKLATCNTSNNKRGNSELYSAQMQICTITLHNIRKLIKIS